MIHTPQLKIQDASYLARQTRPEMLIAGVLARQGVAVVAAPPYKGKTFFALEAMRAVAQGPDGGGFLQRFKVARPGNVLYLGNDSPGWDLASQFDKLIGLPDPKLEDVTALLEDTSLGSYRFIFDTSFTLDHDGNADLLIDAAKRAWSSRGRMWEGTEEEHQVEVRGTDLIVIDTLRSIHGAEENDNTAMQRIMNRLRYIAHETKASVLALHHFNKGSKESPEASLERLRGASAIGGAVDSIYALTGKHPSIAVRVLKNRPAPEQGDFMYDVLDGPWPGSVKLVATSAGGVVNTGTRKIVLEYLASNKGRFVPTSEMLAVLEPAGTSSSPRGAAEQLNRALRSLEKDAIILRVHGAARIADVQPKGIA